jgi:ribosome-associated translation inhibitor RaiA
MRLPLEIKAKGLQLSETMRAEIEDRAAKLDQFYGRLMRCRITVEGPGRHHRRGYCVVRVDLTVPGAQILVTRQRGEHLGEALQEAFSAAGRRVEDYVRRTRGFVKKHA